LRDLTTETSTAERLLAIYLNDHLAGSTLGVELVRRVSSSNREDPELGAPLEQLRTEIEEDRAILEQLMDGLGVRRDRVKPAVAWTGEKLGRLKLNGRLSGYSPLSRVLELEGLCIGIAGKLQLWRALGISLGPRHGSFDFAELAERATRQRSQVEGLHVKAAARAFPEEGIE
jgi:hypothetical protein